MNSKVSLRFRLCWFLVSSRGLLYERVEEESVLPGDSSVVPFRLCHGLLVGTIIYYRKWTLES